MSGLKLLFNRWFSSRVFNIVAAVFFVGMMAAVMILHEDPGNYENDDADYLMCKVSALLPMAIGTLVMSILATAQILGNRFMRAIPAADRMFTVGFPVFGMLMSLGWALATNLTYGVFIIASGRDICNISDMLLITAPFALFCTIMPPVMFSSRVGTIFGCMGYFPFLFMIFWIQSLPESMKYDGFGVPLWASALIAAGAFVLGTAISAIISNACWKKGNFRESKSPLN